MASMTTSEQARAAFALIEPDEVVKLRAGKTPHRCEYGEPSVVTATGRARCRACGERIEKDAPAIRFACDFKACGSWTVVYPCYLHASECPREASRG